MEWITIFSGLTTAGVLGILHYLRRMDMLMREHDLMWYDYCEKHGLPSDRYRKIVKEGLNG